MRPPSGTVRVEVLDRVEPWMDTKAEWNALVASSRNPNVFLSHEFLTSAWESSGRDATLHILSVFDGDTLVGIAPLKRVRRTVLGLPTTMIRAIGGEEPEGNLFIILGDEGVFFSALADHLARRGDLWSKVHLDLLDRDHPAIPILSKAADSGASLVEVSDRHIHPFLRTDDGWEAYLSRLDRKFAHNLRGKIRKLDEAGEMKVVRLPPSGDTDRFLDIFVELENRGWKTGARSGIGSCGNLIDLYRRMLRGFSVNGWADLTLLTLNDRAVAGGIGVVFGDRYSYLQTAYDASANRLSPGIVLMAANIHRAFRAGVNIVDLGGDYVDYKRHFTNDERRSCDLTIRKKFSGEGVAALGARLLAPFRLARPAPHRHGPSAAGPVPGGPMGIDGVASSGMERVADGRILREAFHLTEAPTPGKIQPPASARPAPAVRGIQEEEVRRLVSDRTAARERRDWARADEIRDDLAAHGVVLHDRADGTDWTRGDTAP